MRPGSKKEVTIDKVETLRKLGNTGRSLKNCTLRGLDLRETDIDWNRLGIENTTFLGCTLSVEDEILLRRIGAYIYRAPDHLPYQPFRSELYTWQELLSGYSKEKDNSTDWRIYRHFSQTRLNPSVNEALWQRLHDHAIDDALRDLLDINHRGMTELRCVGFMGGHSVRRDDPYFIKSAETARLLAQQGYFICTGGGPGIMEAANLGAYFSSYTDKDFYAILEKLREAPHYQDSGYYDCALQVTGDYPEGGQSLAIPTWFYGHEPSNLFASHIAKYFSNSIREDTLLAICLHGIIFAPGSAGTTQEIFMDATQNHYGTFNYYSPMVFLSRRRYEIETLIFPLLKQLAWGRKYYELLHVTDEPESVLDFIIQHPPVPVGE